MFLLSALFTFVPKSFSSIPPPERLRKDQKQALEFRRWMSKIVEIEKAKIGGMALQIPTTVATSQSALESANGKSTYAKKYNNYFGLYSGKGHIMKFKTPEESVRRYLLTLLNHKGYERFRQELRQGVDDPYKLLKKVAHVYAKDKRYYILVSSIIRQDLYMN